MLVHESQGRFYSSLLVGQASTVCLLRATKLVHFVTACELKMAPTSLARPAASCLQAMSRSRVTLLRLQRTFTSTRLRRDEASLQSTNSSEPSPPPMPLDPNTVSTYREERLLLYHKRTHPIGSRRRRAAIPSSDNVPFEQMPYQCFQEARKVLAEDRDEKLAQITQMRKRIAHWQNIPAEEQGGEAAKKGRLVAMRKYLEELKILADVNDPVIKKRFEDGMGMLRSRRLTVALFVAYE